MVAMGGFGTALYTGKQREGNGLGEMGILSLYDVTTYGAGRVMGYRGDARKAGRLDTSSAAADWRCRGISSGLSSVLAAVFFSGIDVLEAFLHG